VLSGTLNPTIPLALAFLSHWHIFTTLGKMTDADKVNNDESTTFWKWSGRNPNLD